jgi:HD superfamily phosphohydrolase
MATSVQAKAIIHRDQVHGDTQLDRLSVALLNTAAMQRLGRVYQLGYGHLVFRGGTHTRLSHVMGAAHMATVVVDRLRSNYTQKRATFTKHVIAPHVFLPWPLNPDTPAEKTSDCISDRWDVLRYLVSWAALLHDIGHVPLGHTLEDEFEGIFRKHDDLASPRSAHLWGEQGEVFPILTDEALIPLSFRRCGITGRQVWQTVMLICFFKDIPDKKDKNLDFYGYLAKRDQELTNTKIKEGDSTDAEKRFVGELRRAHAATLGIFAPYMADIVGNTICADYLDYLRRDPLNVGLDVLRDERVLSHFYVSVDPRNGDSWRMALALVDRHGKPRLDVCTGVVELVRQRYRFAELIYYHKTKVAASAMFAKAMSLIGTLQEIGHMQERLDAADIPKLAGQLLADPTQFNALRDRCLPSALLHPEIGDDSLHLLLLYQAFEKIQQNLIPSNQLTRREKKTREDNVKDCLRGVALLQGVVNRRLYKVLFSLDARQFFDLTKGAGRSSADERLALALEKLRENCDGDNDLRDCIEREMSDAAQWPIDSILLYVPERKSQAKGIETFAYTESSIVRLNDHSAVRAKVNELNQDYEKLWRLLVLVHPDYREDQLHLSKAIDSLANRLWTVCGGGEPDAMRLHEAHTLSAINSAAWFPYIPIRDRPAAEELNRYLEQVSPTPAARPDLHVLLDKAVLTIDGQSARSIPDWAERACLVHLVMRELGANNPPSSAAWDSAVKAIRGRFPLPDSLVAHTVPESIRRYEGASMSQGDLGRATRCEWLSSLAKEIAQEIGADQLVLPFDGADG